MPILKRAALAASLLSVAISSVANADSFNNEVYLGYSNSTIESAFAGDVDVDSLSVGVAHYFNDVNTDKGPYAEANLLSPSSVIGYVFSQESFSAKGAGDIKNASTRAFATEIVNDESGGFVSLILADSNWNDLDNQVTAVELGIYQEGTRLAAGFAETTSNVDQIETSMVTFSAEGISPDESGSAIGYVAEVDVIEAPEDTVYGYTLGAKYYPNKNFGTKVVISDTNSTDYVWGIGASLSTENVLGELAYTSPADGDADVISLSLTSRL